MDVDRSLDEIVAAKKANRNRKPRGAGAKGAAGAKAPAPGAQRQQQQPKQKQPQQPQAQSVQQQLGQIVGDKIVVSGLPEDVSEQQVRELFASTVGPMRSCSLAFDSKGKSKGIATIEFKKAADASKAYAQYNKRLIDGKRPMKVEIIVDPSRVPAAPLSSRLGGAPKAPRAVSATVAAAGGSARQARNAPAGGAAAAGAAGAGKRKKAPKPKQAKRPAATLESLDAEMADYQAAKTPAPAAPAAEPTTVA